MSFSASDIWASFAYLNILLPFPSNLSLANIKVKSLEMRRKEQAKKEDTKSSQHSIAHLTLQNFED